jgi:CYTH domain-containing protein
MGVEIERKFLVRGDAWRVAPSTIVRQGYLNRSKERNVRIRVDDHSGFITIKGETQGATRREFEYAIPRADALELLAHLCEPPLIEKRRYAIDYAGKRWIIDEFFGDNAGLIVAEIELQSEDEPLELPDWIGSEVTYDPRYFNANLCVHPFSAWHHV